VDILSTKKLLTYQCVYLLVELFLHTKYHMSERGRGSSCRWIYNLSYNICVENGMGLSFTESNFLQIIKLQKHTGSKSKYHNLQNQRKVHAWKTTRQSKEVRLVSSIFPQMKQHKLETKPQMTGKENFQSNT
jgi:hypothetical protein